MPSQHGDREQARPAPSARTTLVVGGGDIYRSQMSYALSALEHDEATYALDLFTMDESFWLLALTEGEEGRLLRVDAQALRGSSCLQEEPLESIASRFGEWGAVGLTQAPRLRSSSVKAR